MVQKKNRKHKNCLTLLIIRENNQNAYKTWSHGSGKSKKRLEIRGKNKKRLAILNEKTYEAMNFSYKVDESARRHGNFGKLAISTDIVHMHMI